MTDVNLWRDLHFLCLCLLKKDRWTTCSYKIPFIKTITDGNYWLLTNRCFYLIDPASASHSEELNEHPFLSDSPKQYSMLVCNFREVKKSRTECQELYLTAPKPKIERPITSQLVNQCLNLETESSDKPVYQINVHFSFWSSLFKVHFSERSLIESSCDQNLYKVRDHWIVRALAIWPLI